MLNPEDHLGLVRKAAFAAYKWAKRLDGPPIQSADELWGATYQALVVACRNFDPSLGYKPSTLLYRSCAWAARDAAKLMKGWRSKNNSRQLVRCITDICGTAGDDDDDDHSSRGYNIFRSSDPERHESDFVEKVLGYLEEPYKSLVKNRYILGISRTELAKRYKIKREGLRLAEKKALIFLKKVLNGAKLPKLMSAYKSKMFRAVLEDNARAPVLS